jgi:hypothetical protein
MTRALRAALHDAAFKAGCSLNSYALQVLAAAAGDAARFRGSAAGSAEAEGDGLDDLERDRLGDPVGLRERSRHNLARQAYIQMLIREQRPNAGPLIQRLDAEDPAFYVRWEQGRLDEAG